VRVTLPLPGQRSRPIDPCRKSHAKRQGPGYIPRPRNAFLIFRCDLVNQDCVPPEVDQGHANISRLAGKVWAALGDDTKVPWRELQKIELKTHRERYPDYRYKPTTSNRKAPLSVVGPDRPRDGSPEARRARPYPSPSAAPRPWLPQDTSTASPFNVVSALPPRRSSSCPPPPSYQTATIAPDWLRPYVQDDTSLERRPSVVGRIIGASAFSYKLDKGGRLCARPSAGNAGLPISASFNTPQTWPYQQTMLQNDWCIDSDAVFGVSTMVSYLLHGRLRCIFS
jgi:hypothetical protein